MMLSEYSNGSSSKKYDYSQKMSTPGGALWKPNFSPSLLVKHPKNIERDPKIATDESLPFCGFPTYEESLPFYGFSTESPLFYGFPSNEGFNESGHFMVILFPIQLTLEVI